MAVFAAGALLALSACAGKTTGATKIDDGAATLHATASCDAGQTCTWYWEYWRAGSPRSDSVRTPVQGPVSGPTGVQTLRTRVTGLASDATYLWVFCASPNDGGVYACTGPHGTFGSAAADPPPDYATLTTAFPGTLAERWNGTRWRIQTTPNLGDATRSSLASASCTSATACTAVGAYGSTGATVELVERWDGANWTIQSTPTPTGAIDSYLSGVSCASATACTAVGAYDVISGRVIVEMPLVEVWDGTSWTIQPAPEMGVGVSCTSATACTAVGTLDSAPLAERWDGTSWTVQPAPNPSGGQGILNGVSCPSATACTAAGYYFSVSADAQFPLAERWDGTSWAIQPTPTLSGASSSHLSAVSCTSATACTAVGTSTDSAAHTGTLVERWGGTSWTIQPTPDNGATNIALNGVSCTATNRCTAVGSQ